MTTYSNYIVNDDFRLVKADHKEFAIHYSTYRENIFFRQSWERRLSIFNEDTPCYWISLKGHRVGGVSIEPNEMSSL